MSNIKQLLSELGEETIDIFPLNYIENIIDKNTKESLEIILGRVNHIYIPFTGNVAQTRLAVPDIMKRPGIKITYIKDDDIVTETYIGDIENINNDFNDDANWQIELTIKNIKTILTEIIKNDHIDFFNDLLNNITTKYVNGDEFDIKVKTILKIITINYLDDIDKRLNNITVGSSSNDGELILNLPIYVLGCIDYLIAIGNGQLLNFIEDFDQSGEFKIFIENDIINPILNIVSKKLNITVHDLKNIKINMSELTEDIINIINNIISLNLRYKISIPDNTCTKFININTGVVNINFDTVNFNFKFDVCIFGKTIEFIVALNATDLEKYLCDAIGVYVIPKYKIENN